MDNSLQIDNVQSFAEIIGDNYNLWKLLHKKEVSRLKEEVKYQDQKRNIAGVKYYTQGRVYAVHELKTSEVSIEIEYRDGLIFRYKKEQFLRKFSNISPPFSRQEIFELVIRKQEATGAQRRKAEKQILLENLKDQSDVEQRFLELAQKFYQSYLEQLQTTGEDDFDGLMQKAAAVIASGQTVFRRKSGTGDLKCLRYILIDEYQDFSELFHHLIEAIRQQNPQAQFFCVGDDWQAINGFAGSDLGFYQNFAQFFQPSQKLNIATNYRSATSIVDIGNTLMLGLGTPARAHKTIFGTVEIADIGQFNPNLNEQEDHPGDNITPAILRLLDKIIKESIMLTLDNLFHFSDS
jgi:superfamily I DNA/RNA helicase